MEKIYRTSTMYFGILSVLSLLILISGVCFMIVDVFQDALALFLLFFGAIFSLLFIPLFIADHLCYLCLGNDQIVFPITRAPRLRFRRMTVKFSEIAYVQVRFSRGDGLVRLNTTFYTFHLKNGLSFQETLFSYGKEQEQRIVAVLREKVVVKG